MIRHAFQKAMSVNSSNTRRLALVSAFICIAAIATASVHRTEDFAAEAAATIQPNSDPVYQELRNVTPGGKAVAVKDLVLKRDAGTFTFRSGTFYFLAPVKDLVTGAIFIGEATFSLTPPIEIERRNLQLLTKSPEMVEEFSEAVFRFSDGTDVELGKSGATVNEAIPSRAGELLAENRSALRKQLRYNLDIRLLEEVLNDQSGGFFVAFIKGKKYNGKEVFAIDPHGVPGGLTAFPVAPEEVSFSTYDENKFGIWTAFHFSTEYSNADALGRQKNNFIRIPHQMLNTTIDKNGVLAGDATTTIQSFTNGLRVIALKLYPTLRVQSVTGEDRKPLSFIQEKKEEDAQFAVILPEKLAFGKRLTITTEYGGIDAILNTGGGNYYPVARDSWYPNAPQSDNFGTYELLFRTPAGLTMVATGEPGGDTTEGDHTISRWTAKVPIAVAGFNFGRFRADEAKLTDPVFTVQAFVNKEIPDFLIGLRGTGLGNSLEGSTMMKKALGEAQLAVPLYYEYFGPASFDRLAVTQQTAPTYGQSWPTLVFLPITSFLDEVVRARLGERRFFESVDPHEIAHQWWGHTVGWSSYRDQWMSEGFAEFSASLFLEAVYKGEVEKFWNEERKLLLDKDEAGFRAIDVGPVTLGYRLASTRAGFSVPRRLIYPKGAYILNMIRMLYWTNEAGDGNFKTMMHDFVKSFAGRPATTEDFKLTVEKYMQPSFNMTGDGKMDWFFDEYVYGTALPHYKLEYSFSNAPDGALQLHAKLEQSGVESGFRMLVPIYIELPDGRPFRVGVAPLIGNSSFERDITLRGLTQKPKRAMINYFHDVLCTQ